MMVEKRENQRNTQSKRESAMNNWVGFFTQLLLVGLVTERKKKKRMGDESASGFDHFDGKSVNTFFVK